MLASAAISGKFNCNLHIFYVCHITLPKNKNALNILFKAFFLPKATEIIMKLLRLRTRSDV